MTLQRVEDLGREFANGIFVTVDRLRSEWTTNEATQTRVFGRIHLHHRAARFGLFGVHVLNANAESTREDFGVAAREEHVVVFGETPESPSAVALFSPVHRVIGSQERQRVVGHAGDVGVVRGEISERSRHSIP